jgi:hypothetical protein
MKSTFKNIGLVFLLGITMSSCTPTPIPTPTPTPAACVTTGTDFQSLYTSTLSSSALYDNYTTMDLVTHEYTFILSANKAICSIGYQGNATLFASNIPYTIEVYDNTNSVLVYNGNHLFNSASTDYVTPVSTVNLIAGNSYSIKRIAYNYLGNIGNTIGRVCRKNAGPAQFPANFGIMTITSSNFYGAGGPVPNYGIPYIDIVFQ